MKDPVKISSQVDAEAWAEFRRLSEESHQSLSGMLTEAIRDYVRRRRLRPEVQRHLEDSIRANYELGKRLAE